MWHSIPLTLFWFAYFGSLGSSILTFTLSARKRRLDRNRSRFGPGDLAFDRHDRAAVLGPSGRSHRRAHAFAAFLTLGPRWAISAWVTPGLLVHRAGDFCACAGRHGGVSADDFGEFGDLARCRSPRLRPGARLGHRRLFYFGFNFSAGSGISSLPRRRAAWPRGFSTRTLGLMFPFDRRAGFARGADRFSCRKRALWLACRARRLA